MSKLAERCTACDSWSWCGRPCRSASHTATRAHSGIPHTERCSETSSSIIGETSPSEPQKTISDNVHNGVYSDEQQRGLTMSRTKAKRAALYARVSTDQQSVENQLRELRRAVEYERWQEVAVYKDEGVSGTVDRRPGLDAMLEDAKAGKFDVVMVWAIDRLGRSVPGLIKTVQIIHKARVHLFLQRERIDTTTETGELLFTIMAALAQFEAKTIKRRAKAGLDRVKAELVDKKMFTARKSGIVRHRLGRPTVEEGKLRRPEKAEAAKAAREHLEAGIGILKTAKLTGLGTGTVQRLAKEIRAT